MSMRSASQATSSLRTAAVATWIFLVASHWWGAATSTTTELILDRPIVCLGDSLTDFGYPDDLKQLVSVPIEDFGFNGYTTVDGIELLPEIQSKNPQAVILELGGHDYNTGESRFETRKNLIEIIESCQSIGAKVIIIEIPRGIVNDPYYGLERELARKFDLQLIPDTMVRQFFFWSPLVPPGSLSDKSQHLSKDGLHPNANGNKLMARYTADALAKVFGKGVLVNQNE